MGTGGIAAVAEEAEFVAGFYAIAHMHRRAVGSQMSIHGVAAGAEIEEHMIPGDLGYGQVSGRYSGRLIGQIAHNLDDGAGRDRAQFNAVAQPLLGLLAVAPKGFALTIDL